MSFGNYASGAIDLGGVRVSHGDFEHVTLINKFAYVDEIDAADEEDIWSTSGTLVGLSTAETLTVSSTDALTIQITGVDNDYNVICEELVMDGTNDMITVNSFLAVNDACIVKASPNVNTSDITGVATTTGSTQFKIDADNGCVEMCHYTVPDGYSAFLLDARVSTSDNDEATCRIQVAYEDNAYITKAVLQAVDSSAFLDYKNFPPKINERSRLKVKALSRDNNTRVSLNYQLLVVKDEYLE